MYSLTICFGPAATLWAFLFKDKQKAESFKPEASGDSLIIEDDFGQIGMITASTIHGMVLEDLDLTDEAKILRSLANARNEVKARQRAATDPVIRTSAQQGGPSVLTPFRQN